MKLADIFIHTKDFELAKVMQVLRKAVGAGSVLDDVKPAKCGKVG